MDLSSVLFIATANSLDTISDPLYDRMEVIELSGYVHDEKVHIARKYLLPKQLTANALPPSLLTISDDVLLHLVTSYTREAGVRTVERELGAVCRAKAVEYAEAKDRAGEGNDPEGRNADVTKWGYNPLVTREHLERILGVAKYDPEAMDKENQVGVSTGLAYQGSGNGGILRPFVSSFPTGQNLLTPRPQTSSRRACRAAARSTSPASSVRSSPRALSLRSLGSRATRTSSVSHPRAPRTSSTTSTFTCTSPPDQFARTDRVRVSRSSSRWSGALLLDLIAYT